MLNPIVQQNLEVLHKQCLVIDIETSALYSDGSEIPLHDYDNYINHAQTKWIGFYSYKEDKTYCLNPKKDILKIQQLFDEHEVYIGFNCEDFDFPILKNNYLLPDKKFIMVDCMTILGHSKFTTKSGYPYKMRGELMGYKFKKNSLRCMAETMELEVQKGDIDYKIFHKDEWTEQEEQEIKKYLKDDVLATKGLFDKLWNFWLPFSEFIDEKYIYDLSWIKNSVASLTYKSACRVLGVDPTYSDKRSSSESMGGRVILPANEENYGIWYVDFASLYPHIMSMFNLFQEVEQDHPNAWNGNDIFKTKGYYDITSWHPLCRNVADRLKERIDLKANDKENPKIYALKIWLNALYGAGRSSVFEQIHTPNFGWDVCYLGQQIQIFTENMLKDFGFETIAGDTDSLFIKATKEEYNNRDYVKQCLGIIVDIIKDNSPFPVDTFKIDIEHYLDYVMWPFAEEPLVRKEIREQLNKNPNLIISSTETYKDNEEEFQYLDILKVYKEEIIEKKKCIIDESTGKIIKKGRSWIKHRVGRKKNYAYIYKEDGETKIKIMGLPIKKDGATVLGMKIYEEVLQEQILKNKRAKFPESYIKGLVAEYLKKEDIIASLAREFVVKPANTYKLESQIHAQISKEYLNGQEGRISLIKNNKIGKAGKGSKYCTIKEALDNNLSVEDLDLEKVNNELEPFIDFQTIEKKEVKRKKRTKKLDK